MFIFIDITAIIINLFWISYLVSLIVCVHQFFIIIIVAHYLLLFIIVEHCSLFIFR